MGSTGSIIKRFNENYAIRIDWIVNSQDAKYNTSNVTFTINLVSFGGGIYSYARKNISVEIDGVIYYDTCTVGVMKEQNRILMMKTVDIHHNSDGTKICHVSCKIDMNVLIDQQYIDCWCFSCQITLDSIKRKQSYSCISNELKYLWIVVGSIIIDKRNNIGHVYLFFERIKALKFNKLKGFKDGTFSHEYNEDMFLIVNYNHNKELITLFSRTINWSNYICGKHGVNLKFERIEHDY